MSAEECLCQNGGVCVDINGTCECPSGYTGLYCQFGGYNVYNPIIFDKCGEKKNRYKITDVSDQDLASKICEHAFLSLRSNSDTVQ